MVLFTLHTHLPHNTHTQGFIIYLFIYLHMLILTDSASPSGCSEMLMAKVVTDLANRTPGKEAVAMESFAKALMMVRTFCLLSFEASHTLTFFFWSISVV